ncbi:MAG: hypothetical protein H6550_10440 [Chitinophagales bacterium]|nr:hypothetical protein [Chitinophagales bacterium]
MAKYHPISSVSDEELNPDPQPLYRFTITILRTPCYLSVTAFPANGVQR